MSCFLACFGFSSRRRRPTSAHKFISADHSHGCYKPLVYHYDSDRDLHNPSNPTIPDPGLGLNLKIPDPLYSSFVLKSLLFCSDEDVNRTGVPLKKKVTFGGSVVRTYEAIEEVLIDKEEEKGPSGRDSYPPSYRYQNLTENWDEEEEDMIYEESDEMLDDDDDDDDEEEEEDIEEEEDSDPVESEEDIEEEEEDSDPVESEEDSDPVESEDDKEDKTDETKRSRKYMCPVLLPVENVTQWRTIKAKHKRSAKATAESKENIENG